MNHESLRNWERTSLEVLARRSGGFQTAVEEQLRRCSVVSREHTGAGHFSRLHVDGDTSLLPEGIIIDGVWGRLRGSVNDVGFVLFTENGRLSLLEAFANGDDTWPAYEPELVDCWIAS